MRKLITTFKVGDRVKVIRLLIGDSLWGIQVGRIYEVGEIDRDGDVRIITKDGSLRYMADSQIELIKPRKKRGRPQGTKNKGKGMEIPYNGCVGKWHASSECPVWCLNKSNEVTFPITRLPDGTELIFLPNSEWEYYGGSDHDIYRKVKKEKK